MFLAWQPLHLMFLGLPTLSSSTEAEASWLHSSWFDGYGPLHVLRIWNFWVAIAGEGFNIFKLHVLSFGCMTYRAFESSSKSLVDPSKRLYAVCKLSQDPHVIPSYIVGMHGTKAQTSETSTKLASCR